MLPPGVKSKKITPKKQPNRQIIQKNSLKYNLDKFRERK